MSEQLAKISNAELIEKVVLGGDLSGLTPPQRIAYYNAVCQSVGLNPLTRPFEYLTLKDEKGNDKLVLYARRDATDQLRAIRKVNILSVERELISDVVVVTVAAVDADGRQDIAVGAVPIVREHGKWATTQQGKKFFQGDGTFAAINPTERANAFMKAETKAKRRVTLSLCGLGVMDESEIEDIAHPENLEPRTVSQPQSKSEKPKTTVKVDATLVPTWPQVRDAWTPETPTITTEQGKALFAAAKANGWDRKELVSLIETNLATEVIGAPGGEPLRLMMEIVKAPRVQRERQPGEDE